MNRRRQILKAFKKRLDHYGYDKTTMAEIAGDVGISVGTLYLEFGSKEDILGALMDETAREFEAAFRAIADSDRPSPQKLKEVLQTRVELSDRCCRAGAHSVEVLLAGAEKCREMKCAREERFVELLERLVAEGVERGELETADPLRSARLLRDAISPYLPPESLAHPSEEILARARELGELVVRGLQTHLVRA